MFKSGDSGNNMIVGPKHMSMIMVEARVFAQCWELSKHFGCAAQPSEFPWQNSGWTIVSIPLQTSAQTRPPSRTCRPPYSTLPSTSSTSAARSRKRCRMREGAHRLWGKQGHDPHMDHQELDECHSTEGEGILCGLHQIPEVSEYGFIQPAGCVMEGEGTWVKALVQTEKQDKTQAKFQWASLKMQVNTVQAQREFRHMDSIQDCTSLLPPPLWALNISQSSSLEWFCRKNTEVILHRF